MTAAGATLTSGQLRAERWRLRIQGWRSFWRRYRRKRAGVLGLAVLVVFGTMALFPSLLAGPFQDVTAGTPDTLVGPGAAHLLGTDELGRDILNLTVYGARTSLTIGLVATFMTIFLGAVVGIAAGYIGGAVDTVLMRITDFFLILPTFVLALILAPIVLDSIKGTPLASGDFFGVSVQLVVIILIIAITSWASTARILRSQTLSLKERAFVDRARVIGSSSAHIMWRHILPNCLALIVANAVLTVTISILTESTLSFVGLGDPSQPSWGQMLESAQSVGAPGLGAWWYTFAPGISIVLVMLAFTLVGNALDEILNPKLSVRG